MVDAVIVDFYGVLYSNFNWPAIDARIKSDEGKSQEFAYLKTLSNRGKLRNDDFLNKAAVLAGDNRHPEDRVVMLDPHINKDLIDKIKTLLPEAKLGILSNGNKIDVVRQVKECGLENEFEVVLTSSDIGFAKPEQAAFEETFDRLGVDASKTVIIDDSPVHTAAAQKYGYRVIMFEDNDSTLKELETLAAS